MRAPWLFLLAVLGPWLWAGCEDPCASGPEPTVEIGRLVGTAGFEPLDNGEEVTLGFAPQGGSGVMTALRTTGLSAHENMIIFPRSVSTHLVVDGVDENGNADVLGDFTLSPSVYCVDNSFGLVTNVIFGLDPERFQMPESVAGRQVTLNVEAEDENSARATTQVDVVFAEVQ